MKIIADLLVELPFTLDYCAEGPDVASLLVPIDDIEITIYFPPSMSEGTVGQSFFPSGWAWWTGKTLRVSFSHILKPGELELELIRSRFLSVGNLVLRRLLKSCFLSNMIAA